MRQHRPSAGVTPSGLKRAFLLAGCAAAFGLARPAAAQSGMWDEMTVGSEMEMYARVLALRGIIADAGWAIRPFAPRVLARWDSSATQAHPWQRRIETTRSARAPMLLRPSGQLSFNSAFPWGQHDGPVWQGRGVNAWATAGASARWRALSFRVEPVVQYSANASFELETLPASSDNPYFDPMTPGRIDLPQRFGEGSRSSVHPGQSSIRYDDRVAFTFSTANVFWGPAFRNPALLGPGAGGFPHVTIGLSEPVNSRLGRWHGQLLYGQLTESDWAPDAKENVRFGSGYIFVWAPPGDALELGIARFVHSRWRGLTPGALAVPFGSLRHTDRRREDEAESGTQTNELASAFFRVKAMDGVELFGEFGKNDRPEDRRDLLVELELNSSWSLGILSAWDAGDRGDMWSLRLEYVNARIASIDRIGRNQNRFYSHSQWRQGHTAEGQLLGSPLMERTGGAELALDRWASWGRLGVTVFERQMPEAAVEAMRDATARTQWDLGLNGLLFLPAGDLSVAAGTVYDVQRFPGRDASNFYLRAGWRLTLP